MKPCIRLTAKSVEDPGHLFVKLEASNGRITASSDIFASKAKLKELADQLEDSRGEHNTHIDFTYGSEDPEVQWAGFFSLVVRPVDTQGHCCVLVRGNNMRVVPNREIFEFCIETEWAQVNHLGQMLQTYIKMAHRILEWHPLDPMLCALHP
jgi:hypothetical protein